MHFRDTTPTRLSGLLVALIMTVVISTLSVGPAHAAVMAPTGLSPNGSSASGVPVLAWDWSPGAASYNVQVAADSGFNSIVWTGATVNRRIVPTKQPPTDATYYWRVQSRSGTELSEWTTATVTRSAVPGPSITSPADGATLPQPDQPVLLSWESIAGSDGYAIEISTSDDFVDQSLITRYSTDTSSFVVPSPQLATTYHWRVRATLGAYFTEWSASRSYVVPGLAGAVSAMPNNPLNTFGSVVMDGADDDDVDDAYDTLDTDDFYVDWAPIAGATSYDVQISPDPNFLSADTHTALGVVATRYARPATMNNDDYYWRVRAHDALGHVQDWQTGPGGSVLATGTVNRRWDAIVRLKFPYNEASPEIPVVVTGPMYFEWDPVRLASEYKLEVSADSSFGAGDKACLTVATTFTPSHGSCMPTAGETMYWRVTAYDRFGSESSIPVTAEGTAQVGRFTYRPDRPTLRTPLDDATEVRVPTMSWHALPGAARYILSWAPVAGGPGGGTVTTTGTSYTPRSLLPAGEYRWDVQSETQNGQAGTSIVATAQRTFAVVSQTGGAAETPEPIAPNQTGAPFGRFPTLTWTPVAGANRYTIGVRRQGATGAFTLVTDPFVNPTYFSYPAGEDRTANFLAADTYEWIVTAYSGSTVISTSSSPGLFRIASPGKVTGQTVGLTGTSLMNGDACETGVDQGCQNLRQTPVLMWDKTPASGDPAGYWKMYLSRNDTLTNLVGGYPIDVYDNVFTPTVALADFTAGNGYYWHARPCSAEGKCSPLPAEATNYFNKRSLPVTLTGPGGQVGSSASAQTVQDDVTFEWVDYLRTQQTADVSAESVSARATSEARRYEIQVSSDPNFTTFLDNTVVDGTSFTSATNTYPEGNNYWRVRAVDGSQNPLEWSTTFQFVKRSPVPATVSPSGGQTVDGLQPLRWIPLPFAASYDVEVYKNNDASANPANLVLSGNSKQVAFSPAQPIPASSDPYVWRVRRVDAKGRKGGWNATLNEVASWSSFKVAGQVPQTTSPGAGAAVPPSEALFTWSQTTDATSYRFERRAAGSTALAEAVVTPALAHAPTVKIADGTWQWRVVSLDAAGKDLAASAWLSFTVSGSVQVITGPQITGSGVVGTLLTASAPSWNLAGVATTYQWYRGLTAIPGAMGSVHSVSAEDIGKAITVRVTGSLPGYTPGVATSNAITSNGAAPVATVTPSVAGASAVGSTLTASTGTWSDAPRLSIEWLRDGVPIPGATGTMYKTTPVDATRGISIKVTATKPSFANGEAVSGVVRMAKMVSATSSALSKTKAPRRTRVMMTITVVVGGVASPTGSILVKDGRKTLKKVTLTGTNKGTLTFKLPRLKAGKHAIKTVYQGSSVIGGSRSKAVKLIVTR